MGEVDAVIAISIAMILAQPQPLQPPMSELGRVNFA